MNLSILISMKKDHLEFLLEDIQSKMEGVAEDVGGLHIKADLLDQRLAKVEKDTRLIPAVKLAVTDQTHQLNDHQKRLTKLEAV